MGSSKDFQTGMIFSGGWWNTGRSLLPSCVAPPSDFMRSNSSQHSINKQAEMQQVVASYSKSDDSDDHHSSSAEHLPVMSSDYAQIFQDVQKPQTDDFGVSDWLQSSLNSNFLNHVSSLGTGFFLHIFYFFSSSRHDSSSQEFHNQFDTTYKVSQMGLGVAYPAMLQNQVGPDAEMNYIFDNNFVASATTAIWPKLLSPKLYHGTKRSSSNHATPLWSTWMNSEESIGAQESDQPLDPAYFKDQKPYKKDTSYKLPDTTIGTKRNNTSNEMYKRPRIETPSSLPTFKVRKEKLGDRITSLQQLVSPFGKTDTASVLHEAVEYIKFLHVQVLRTPYMQNGTTTNQNQQMQGESVLNTPEGPKQDLRSRGLCLVPISSTFPLANETTSDFWTPSFEGTIAFR